MNIVITGANFNNKGAQTMLFITAYELKKRYPSADIYYVSAEKLDISIRSIYTFKYLYRYAYLDALHKCADPYRGINGLYSFLYSFCRKIIKGFLYKESRTSYAVNILKDTRFIVDVSGFSLSSKFKKLTNSKRYLEIIELEHKLNIPVVLMPQSFGPFNYCESVNTKMQEDIQRIMKIGRASCRERV